MTDKPHDDIKKIADLLAAARAENVLELEAEIPFFTTTDHYGIMRVKAKWLPVND